MTVQFMLENHQDYESSMAYDIIESVVDYTLGGYDILRVETDDFRKIHIFDNHSGIEYEADAVIKAKDGDHDIYVVSIWNPIEV